MAVSAAIEEMNGKARFSVFQFPLSLKSRLRATFVHIRWPLFFVCGQEGCYEFAMAKKILVVEDNELNRKLIADLLSAKGYEIIVSENGEEAVDLALEKQPDLILMDIRLPGMTGIEALKVLRDDMTTRTIPVAAVSGFAMKGDDKIILSAGFDAYIAKPISTEPFLEEIHRLVGE